MTMNIDFRTLIVLLAVLVLAANQFIKSKGDKQDKRALIKDGALLIDVRSPGEFAEGHIEGALNIPYNAIVEEINEANKDRAIIVYCYSGSRSGAAKKYLEKDGFTQVINGGSFKNMKRELTAPAVK